RPRVRSFLHLAELTEVHGEANSDGRAPRCCACGALQDAKREVCAQGKHLSAIRLALAAIPTRLCRETLCGLCRRGFVFGSPGCGTESAWDLMGGTGLLRWGEARAKAAIEKRQALSGTGGSGGARTR